MKRKLVKQGSATMMISLPTKWIKENKLEKGDEIDLEEEGSRLIISKDTQKTKKEIIIDITVPHPAAIRVMITNAYRSDYNKIKVTYKEPKTYEIIKQLLDEQLFGYEILEKEKDFCIIENIASLEENQFDNIFSKLIMNIEDSFDHVEQLINGEKPDFEKTQNKTKEFDNLCRRIIAREDKNKSEVRLDFNSELIHAQRELYLLMVYMTKNKTKFDKSEIELLRNVRKSFNMIKEAYQKKSVEILEKLIEFEQQEYKNSYKLLEKTNPIIVHHLMNSLRGFYLCASPLMGILI